MAMSLFGKKPSDKGPATTTRPGKSRERSETTTSLDLTQLGDGRALAAAAGKILVSEGSLEEHAAVEEAAILYANSNNDGARSVLEAAIDGTASKHSSHELWAMLFDLYRITGQRAAFDARSEIFSQTFEVSPPRWDESAPPPPAAPARPNAPAVNLSGNLSGNARTQFEQLVRIGQKMGKLRIDLSRLRGIDDAGCLLLNDTLAALRRARVEVFLVNARHALSLVEPKLKIGEKQSQAAWLLALALIQQSADAEHFDAVALDYAITFEESPPAYEAPPAAPEVVELPPVAAVSDQPERFAMNGDVTGNQPEVLRQLAVYASQRSRVEIDASGLKRIEFVSAGALFNQLAQLQNQGKLSLIYRPNALVAALMRVMGIDQVATIERQP
ncbi:STAS domain-containing protein [Uliginosibacterium sediminicola]|uniref:STAS domain-containing protein n=1 Tax=Uliginosibacterium sediminicola TaxID=2024550 RepID=A0ABU9YVE4_9RHOO